MMSELIIEFVVKKNNLNNLHKNCIFDNFQDIWQNIFRALSTSIADKKRKIRVKYFVQKMPNLSKSMIHTSMRQSLKNHWRGLYPNLRVNQFLPISWHLVAL